MCRSSLKCTCVVGGPVTVAIRQSDSPSVREQTYCSESIGAPARWAGVDFPRVSNLHLCTSVWYSGYRNGHVNTKRRTIYSIQSCSTSRTFWEPDISKKKVLHHVTIIINDVVKKEVNFCYLYILWARPLMPWCARSVIEGGGLILWCSTMML